MASRKARATWLGSQQQSSAAAGWRGGHHGRRPPFLTLQLSTALRETVGQGGERL